SHLQPSRGEELVNSLPLHHFVEVRQIAEPPHDRPLVLGDPAEDDRAPQCLVAQPLEDNGGMSGGNDLNVALAGDRLQVLDEESDASGVETRFDLLDQDHGAGLGGAQREEGAEKVKGAVGDAASGNALAALLDEDRHDVAQLLDVEEIDPFDLRSTERGEPVDEALLLGCIVTEASQYAGQVFSVFAELLIPAAIPTHLVGVDPQELNAL